jgi:NADH dehydrogenase
LRILVTGASSFVGAHFCTLAASRGHHVVGLWNRTPLLLDGISCVTADVTAFRPAKVDVVVHLATKVMAADAREQNRRMLDSVLSWRLPVVYASSTVVHWPRKNAYAESRVEDEERVRSSGLPWLIVRPCAPYGPAHATHRPAHVESFHRLATLARTLPVVPVIGDGGTLRQPVHVEDFNAAILGLLDRNVWNAAYDAGGPEALTLHQIINVLAGHDKAILPIPEAAAATIGRFVPGFSPELLRTFATDDTVDPRPLREASGVTPRPFSADV